MGLGVGAVKLNQSPASENRRVPVATLAKPVAPRPSSVSVWNRASSQNT
jgi:hypothetical protein